MMVLQRMALFEIDPYWNINRTYNNLGDNHA